jgi:hypothetical protein
MPESLSGSSPNRAAALPSTILYALGIFLVAAAGLVVWGRYHRAPAGAERAEVSPVPGLRRAGEPGFEYYKTRVRLSDVKAQLGINYAKSRIAIVSGNIANEGDRKLEALELHIALYDIYDKLSKERVATPLRPGVGIKRAMNPLEKRPFTVWIEPIEQLWNPKRVEIEITGLKYQ